MDHIQEMLKRQAALLSVLMLGSEEPTEQETEAERLERQDSLEEQTAEIKAGGAHRTEPYSGQTGTVQTEQTRQAASGSPKTRLDFENQSQMRRTAEMSANISSTVWNGPTVTEREFENTRRMSLAIQRDARRYDGGFSIY